MKNLMSYNPDTVVSDPGFDGVNSVMWLRLDSALRFSSHLSLLFRPAEHEDKGGHHHSSAPGASDGVIAHLGQGENSGHDDFFSLALM